MIGLIRTQTKHCIINYTKNLNLRPFIHLIPSALGNNPNSKKTFSLVSTIPFKGSSNFSKNRICFMISGVLAAIAGITHAENESDIDFSKIPTKSYGNKHAGIIKVEDYLKKNPLKRVGTPTSKGLSHEAIYLILSKKNPEIFIKWEKMKKLYNEYENKDFFLSDPQILKLLSEIKKTICDTFKKLSPQEITSLSQLDELDAWILELKKKKSYVMVRSSSTEDLEKVLNAGGNLSEEYIEPDLSSILASSARVISSYFGVPSLRNQIEAGMNPFQKTPTLSVMFQELIGEEVGGSKDLSEIPVSLVLFTTEPSESEENFHLAKISSSYGHGSGIVYFGKVNTDRVHFTYLENNDVFEAYQNRLKEFRLAPVRNPKTSKVSLEAIKNPLSLQKKRSLDSKMIKRLAHLSKHIEKAFNGQAMDVEIVIKNDFIYIVQARPVKRVLQAKASYVSPIQLGKLKKSPILEHLTIKVLAAGKASAMIINTPSQVLICDNLKQAEDIPGSKNKQVVIVATDEENTHPIVNFSSHGVTCLYVKDLQKAKEISNKIALGSPLVICPQSKAIYLWDNLTSDPQTCIEQGHFSHTASLGFSLLEDPEQPYEPIKKRVISPEIENLIQTLKASKTTQVFQKSLFEIKKIVASDIAKAKHSYTLLKKKNEKSEILEKLGHMLEKIFFELEKPPLNRTHTLFLINSLEKLLGNQPKDALFTYSLLDAQNLYSEASKIIVYRSKLKSGTTPHFEDLLPYLELCSTVEGMKAAEKFLLNLESVPFSSQLCDKKNKVISFFSLLKEHDALEPFINTIALPAIVDSTDPEKTLEALSSHPIDFKLLKDLQQKKEKIFKIKNSLELFQDPNTFNPSWKELCSLLSFFDEDPSFHPLEELSMMCPPTNLTLLIPDKNNSPLTNLLAIETLKELVDVTDLAIKSMKQSPFLTNETKVTFLKKMLKINDKLLKVWLINLFPEKTFAFNKNWDLDKYINHVVQVPVNNSLDPSVDFSAAAAVINAGTEFSRHLPETLEDKFTLIHQNQIIVIQTLLSQILEMDTLNKIPKSPLFNKAVKEFSYFNFSENIKNLTTQKANLDGIDLTATSLKYSYNVPLSNHSARFSLEQTKEGKILLHSSFLGPARTRWSSFKCYLEALDFAKGITLEKPCYLSENELSFTLNLENEDQITFIRTIFSLFLEHSLSMGRLDATQFIDVARKMGLETIIGQWYVKNGSNYLNFSKEFTTNYFNASWPISIFWVLGLGTHFKSYGLSSNPKILQDEVNNLIFLVEILTPLLEKYPFIDLFSQFGNLLIPAIENFVKKEEHPLELMRLISSLIYFKNIKLPISEILEYIERKNLKSMKNEEKDRFYWLCHEIIYWLSKKSRISPADGQRFALTLSFILNKKWVN